jgi:hypothetical protein
MTPGSAHSCPAIQLTGGAALNGALDGQASCRYSSFLADTYQIVLPVSGTLNIDLSSGDFTSLLFLQDAKNNSLYFGEDTTDNGSAHIQIPLPAGTYYALAASADLPGGYTINYMLTPAPIPNCPAPKALALNTAFAGTLGGKASCTTGTGALEDRYGFTTTSAGVVAAAMTSNDIDSLLRLQDSKGALLRSDNNSYSQGNAIIVQFLPAGTYTLLAQADGFQNTGSYQVGVLFTKAASQPQTCAPKASTLGTPGTATLGYTGCQYYDGTFSDLYSVKVTDASGPLDIAASSTAFDTYLVLLDSKGNVLSTDDNSGGGTDAHILENVTPGTYFVVVKPASDPASAGSYTLIVQ